MCPRGYEGNGRVCEMRPNPCENQPCDEGLQCIEIDDKPFYTCRSCPDGFFSEDGINCIDIDECYSLRPCDAKARCTNLSPGFRCDPCPAGYNGQHYQGLFMTFADHTFVRQRCDNIDECRQGTAKCGANSQCLDTEGSYTCSCLTGFIRSNTTTGCVKIPGVCDDGVTVCDKNANCRNIGGRRFDCKCRVGFAGDGFRCGSDRDLDGFPDIDLKCAHPNCRQDNCPRIPVRIDSNFNVIAKV